MEKIKNLTKKTISYISAKIYKIYARIRDIYEIFLYIGEEGKAAREVIKDFCSKVSKALRHVYGMPYKKRNRYIYARRKLIIAYTYYGILSTLLFLILVVPAPTGMYYLMIYLFPPA